MSKIIKPEDLNAATQRQLLVSVGWPEEQIQKLETEEWPVDVLLKAYAQDHTPESLELLDIWSKRYLKEGHLWGDDVSVTAQYLIDNLPPNQTVLDIGFGYGRDTKPLLSHGHKVHGFEISSEGMNQARKLIKKEIDAGNAFLTEGDFIKASVLQGAFNAASCHRMLHLLEPEKIGPFVTRLAGALADNGLVAITARNPDDFNEKEMLRINENTALYEKRPGHYVYFWDEERFKKEFSKYFNIESFHRYTEMESESNKNDDGSYKQSHLTMMVARRKPRPSFNNGGFNGGFGGGHGTPGSDQTPSNDIGSGGTPVATGQQIITTNWGGAQPLFG